MVVALGVSGGIAAYKACEIIRALDRAGAEVEVLLTENGARFVTPLTLQTLSRRKILCSTFDTSEDDTIRHIDLSRRISALLVAPATANVLAKFSHGVADDLLSTFYTSVTAPVLVAPAMNTRMLLHPPTQENLTRLRRHGVRIIQPEHGWLAEREVGWGRMAEPWRIVDETLAAARSSTALQGRTIVVTAGPTRESVDPVRFVGNRSSGKMGYALAEVCARQGAKVVLISGPVALAPPFGVTTVAVTTAAEMRAEVLQVRNGADAVFMAAAVADYVPRAEQSKIKKTGGSLTLTLDEGPDILAELGSQRQERLLIGFAAETDDLLANAQSKLERKNLDFIVANDVSSPVAGFDSDDNAVTVLSRTGEALEVPLASKREIAAAIVERVFGAEMAENQG